MMYDVIIIGAGPAGLTAALYLRRAEKSVLLLEKGAFGGQITYSPKIENYPGIESASGNEIAEKIVGQVMDLGADVEVDEAIAIEDKGAYKTVVGKEASYDGKAVIIATGAKHRMLGLEGEENYVGEGLSFCAVCDGAFYKEKDVIVVGGGNSAKQEAILLAKLCNKVTMVQNLAELTGEKVLTEEVLATENIEVIYSSLVTEYLAEDGVLSGVKIRSQEMGEEKDLKADGVFLAIGLVPDCKAFENLITLDKWGYAASSENCDTKTDGVFVAGDCRAKKVRQISTATADGVNAALGTLDYLDALAKA
ncbi:MAG: FAD-dependent oxidoreductase [Clostridia bacterium]|nr:FAD-dependent oxidoreductase [Clostridia bacterium]